MKVRMARVCVRAIDPAQTKYKKDQFWSRPKLFWSHLVPRPSTPIEAFIHSLRTIIYCTVQASLRSPFRSGPCKRWST